MSESTIMSQPVALGNDHQVVSINGVLSFPMNEHYAYILLFQLLIF